MVSDLRDLVLSDIRLHPRVAYQGLMADRAVLESICKALPPLTYFRTQYHGALAVVDWDHRLPSDALVLRIFGYYDETTFDAGQEAYDDRLEEIGRVDKYPEFDVPDFDHLAADEAYEVELSLEGDVGATRLTSAWRREIGRKDSKVAVDVSRKSEEFKLLKKEVKDRPPFLGDLEAVSWTPPCESQHMRWTIDVWYLLNFDGRIGTGRSFLIDVKDKSVVASRDFSVRTG